MRLFSIFTHLLILIIIGGCSSSYKDLSNNSYAPPSKFSKHLFESYKLKADFEASEMHDWNSAKLYSEKALMAAHGIHLKPEKLSNWKIPDDKISELNISHKNLMAVYKEAIIVDPYNLAIAISSIDCWAEQLEENWQTWDINKCRDDFLNSMHNIYEKLSNKEIINTDENIIEDSDKKSVTDSNKESVTVVTKNNKEEILQLIYFDFDKSKLSEVSIYTIKNFINKNRKKINKYIIVGHTDTKGSQSYNMNLSIQRAEEVKKILLDMNIEKNNIKILGRGEKDLLVHTKDEIAHPANRRAEIKPLN